MNTEISPENTIACSKGHGKLEIITVSDLAERTSGCNVQSSQTTCYRNLTWQTKAWHASTKYKEQNSLTELILKINTNDGIIHANMANDMTDSE